jgi:hypothetical protein
MNPNLWAPGFCLFLFLSALLLMDIFLSFFFLKMLQEYDFILRKNNLNKFCKKYQMQPDVVRLTCNSGTGEGEAGGSQVHGQPGLHS